MEGATSDLTAAASRGDPHPDTAIPHRESVLTLVVTAPESVRGQEFPVRAGELTIGRGSTSDIRIDNPYVSRRHALIRRAGAEVVIEDAGSSAGVIVNGERVTEPRALQVGDAVRLGTVELMVERREPNPDVTVPEAPLPTLADRESPPQPHKAQAEASVPDAGAALSGLDISAEAAQRILIEWASHKPLVDEKMFSGALAVENSPRIACRFVRLIETRQEKEGLVRPQEQVPSLQRYTGALDAVTVPEPPDFEHRSWRLILAGSEQQTPCPANCANGGQHCSRCHGRGHTRCVLCQGSGQKHETRYINGQVSHRHQMCPLCAGSGHQRCTGCRGSGWVPCETCRGAGSMISFVLGEIGHTPTEIRISERLPDEVTESKLPRSEWALIATMPGDSVPDVVPGQLRTELSRELEAHEAGERKRQLEIHVLPLARIRITDHPEAAVQIAGTSGVVFASGLASRRRLGWGAALVAAAVVILLLILVLAHVV